MPGPQVCANYPFDFTAPLFKLHCREDLDPSAAAEGWPPYNARKKECVGRDVSLPGRMPAAAGRRGRRPTEFIFPINENKLMSETLGYIHSVETFGLVDGPGVRYIPSFAGAVPLRCQYCHNPRPERLRRTPPAPTREAFTAAYRYRNYWRGNGRLTISGEPLCSWTLSARVFRLARAQKVRTALDTSTQPLCARQRRMDGPL